MIMLLLTIQEIGSCPGLAATLLREEKLICRPAAAGGESAQPPRHFPGNYGTNGLIFIDQQFLVDSKAAMKTSSSPPARREGLSALLLPHT